VCLGDLLLDDCGGRGRLPAWVVAVWRVFRSALEQVAVSSRLAVRRAAEKRPVFLDGEHPSCGGTLVVIHTVPCSGRLWTMALCRRFVSAASERGEPMCGGISPAFSMVTPRCFRREWRGVFDGLFFRM